MGNWPLFILPPLDAITCHKFSRSIEREASFFRAKKRFAVGTLQRTAKGLRTDVALCFGYVNWTYLF